MNIRKYRQEIVFLIDSFILFIINSILFFLFQGSIELQSDQLLSLFVYDILFLFCWIIAQIIFKTYNSLWRYARSEEYLMMFLAGISGFVLFEVLNSLLLDSYIPILYSFIAYAVAFLCMVLMRMSYRLYRRGIIKRSINNQIPLAIIGANEHSEKLLEELKNNPDSKYQVSFFIDDDKEQIGKRIHKVLIKGPINQLEELLRESQIREVVIAMPSLSVQRRCEILSICTSVQCRVRILPDTLSFLMEEKTDSYWNNVREVNVEELLGREPVKLNDEEIGAFLHKKIVMVTGGGGSIGSELCRQIAKARIKKLIIVDIYENNAYDIQQELHQIYKNKLKLKVEIASVRDEKKVNQLVKYHRPNIIFHAAAHKHVPLMEDCPEEAIMNNIFGTYHMVQAANRYGVDKFVLISTDKAVNPTNIMGASKRFCEMILQGMKEKSKTEFVAVRFGNVLGSNGSVIPLFQKQIARGGPVTITDKRIVRYFMTISEAVQLVLEAGAMANSSEVYVLDMGEPVKIIDLAENLIRLSGHVPYTQIPIIETGLRPGEKLYEEMLQKSEELIATKNHKIYIERQSDISMRDIEKKLRILRKALQSKSKNNIKKAMKRVIETYKDPHEVNDTAKEDSDK
ncbi:MAG: nucleoside-diphosphate sugar epimerase/dehydratase [Mobilitalea sp.]